PRTQLVERREERPHDEDGRRDREAVAARGMGEPEQDAGQHGDDPGRDREVDEPGLQARRLGARCERGGQTAESLGRIASGDGRAHWRRGPPPRSRQVEAYPEAAFAERDGKAGQVAQMVGLTGGIGSGKSTVASLLAERGAIVIDADAIAREVVEPGTPTLAKLVERFGPEIMAADGSLDRAALAERAFVTDEAKKDLEAITHPAIGEAFLRRVAEAPENGVVVHDVPLLVESTRGFKYDAVIVVE